MRSMLQASLMLHYSA